MSARIETGRAARGRAGFTVIELVVTVGLVAVVMANIWMVVRDSSQAYGMRTIAYDAEIQAQRTLDRISEALLGASRDSLVVPTEHPGHTDELDFEISIGFEDGEVRFGAPQRIALDDTRSVLWFENPGDEGERKVVWTHWVRELLEGEVDNDVDDNGNGLIDERGLSFSLEGNMVVTRLTIERPGPDGKLVARTLQSRVTCRN